MQKPDNLNWNAAPVELPEMPSVSPGADGMSMTIATVLPMLAAELGTSVTMLAAKENMFSGKLTAAESAYQNADDSGQQSVGQVGSMLGDLGKMAQQAAGSAGGGGGGGGGIFSKMMEQAMKMAEGLGGSNDDSKKDPSKAGQEDPNAQTQSGPGAGAQVNTGQQPAPAPANQQPANQAPTGAPQHQAPRDEASAKPDQREHRPEARPPVDSAAPGEGQRGAGPAPVTPQEPAHRSTAEDLQRRL